MTSIVAKHEGARMIGYTTMRGRGDTDLLLHRVATDLAALGLRACGVVQINTDCEGRETCDMDVIVLPSGPSFRISQDLGQGTRGCRLDPAALEASVGHVTATLQAGADFMIINKFGKQEADGRGFRQVISEAIAQGIPVLVGVNGANRHALLEFAGEFAIELLPDAAGLTAWIVDQCAPVISGKG